MLFYITLLLVKTALALEPARRSRVEIKPHANASQSIVIAPKLASKEKEETTSFQLSQSGGKLILSFHSKDPKLELNPQGPLMIQLNPVGSFDITPAVITQEEWPKGQTEMILQYQGISTTEENRIEGKAAYTVCDKVNKNCARKKARFSYVLSP